MLWRNGYYHIQFILSRTPGPGEAPQMMVTRLRTTPTHGGKRDFFIFFMNYLLLIRRGGVPSGAAAFIVPD